MILAHYLRLSDEDDDMIDESNSITNQRLILQREMEQRADLNGFGVREYVDDGFSGKNFNRPGITRLLDDIKGGKVHGVMVKDFSRFGRDHIELGNYIEKIFPLLRIRFIAVNNRFDSNDYIGTTPDMDVGFENLMYDYFSEENSIKIKNDLLKRRMRGNYMATFAPYGYIKAPDNRNQIVVDEEAATVVRLIFETYAECGVKADVARYLNEKGILTPQEYAKSKGMKYQWKYKEERKQWNGSIIGRILRNQIYIGNTVFHKKECMEVGSRRTKCLPKEEWKVCADTHEAIVSKGLFDIVNLKVNMPESDTSESEDKPDQTIYCEGEKRKRSNIVSPIKGIVKCGGCMHALTRRDRLNATFYCRHYYELKNKECCSKNVKEAELIEIVLSTIRNQAVVINDLEQLYTLYLDSVTKQQKQIENERKSIQDKIEKYNSDNFSLYEKYAQGKMERNDFVTGKERNNRLIEECNSKLSQYTEEKQTTEMEDLGIFQIFGDKGKIADLTKEVAEQLISAIYVYNDNRIKIVFKFNDELEKLVKSMGSETFEEKN